MYIKSKKILCAGIAAAMILSTASTPVRADKSYDSTNVGIISQVDEFIETKGDRAVESLTGTAVETAAAPVEEKKEEPKKAPEKKAEAKKEKAKYPQFEGKAVAVCETELNIRTKKDADAEVVGTLARYGIAKVKEKDTEWTLIESGSCKGYVRTEYLKFGDDAAKWYLDNGFSEVVTVDTETLTLRGEADINSECLAMVGKGESYDILERGKEWTKIQVDDDLQGYVNNKYIEIGFKTVDAVSYEEQEKLLAEEEKTDETAGSEEKKDENADNTADAAPEKDKDETLDENKSEEDEEVVEEQKEDSEDTEDTDDTEDEDSDEESDEESDDEEDNDYDDEDSDEDTDDDEDETEDEPHYAAPAGQTGIDIANYALQFVGNPYVWGGTSLTDGADCSGFVYTIYADFGYSLPRCADDQALVGTEVSFSELEPGDLLFYGDDSIGHVAMYIGNGMIVHAASSSQGIITSNYDYHTPCKAVRIVNQ